MSASAKNFVAQLSVWNGPYSAPSGKEPFTPPRSPGSRLVRFWVDLRKRSTGSTGSSHLRSPVISNRRSQIFAICASPVRQLHGAAGDQPAANIWLRLFEITGE